MGYHATFRLEAVRRPGGEEVIEEGHLWNSARNALAESVERIPPGHELFGVRIIELGRVRWADLGDYDEPAREFENRMAQASKGIPYIFTFFLEGEHCEDLWFLDVYDGKSYRREAIVTYPEFDITKLTS